MQRPTSSPTKRPQRKTKKSHHRKRTGPSTRKNLRRNPAGGVYISSTHVKAAYRVLDSERKGYIDDNDLERVLPLVSSSVDARQVSYLLGAGDDDSDDDAGQLSFQELKRVVQGCALQGVDPEVEAFNMMDPLQTGFVDLGLLRRILNGMGVECTAEDVKAVVREFDRDGDGRLGWTDFRDVMDG